MNLVFGDQPVLYLQTVDCGKMMPKEDAIADVNLVIIAVAFIAWNE